MQTQTRRLQKIAILASRQEAEFVSGVLEAADVPHAIVEVGHGLELRVDPDDSERVRELIERLDVRREVAEGTRQRRGEATGRWIGAWMLAVLTIGATAWWLLGYVGVSRSFAWGFVVVVALMSPVLAWVWFLRMRRLDRSGPRGREGH